MKKVVLLTLVSGVALPLLGDMAGIKALEGAKTLTTTNVTNARKGEWHNLQNLRKIQRIIDRKSQVQKNRVLSQYNQISDRIRELEKQPTIQKAQPTRPISIVRTGPPAPPTGPPPVPEGAFKPTPTGPPPIPAGALDKYPTIQGPKIPMAPPPAKTPIAAPPRITIPKTPQAVTGVKPAGPRAAKAPAVTDERQALLEQIRKGKPLLRPASPSAPRKQETTLMEELLRRRRRSIAPEEFKVEDEDDEWETN